MMKPMLCAVFLGLLGWTDGALAAPPKKHSSAIPPPAPAVQAAKPPEKPAPPALPPGQWQAFVEPESQIFPSLLLASATLKPASASNAKPDGKTPPAPDPVENLGDSNGLAGITITSPADNTHVHLVIRENALMETSALDVDLPVKGRQYHLLPKVNYKYASFYAIRQSWPMNVVFSLQLDGKPAAEQIVTAHVRPLSDCPYAYVNPDDPRGSVDVSWMFAAFVNEDDPAIPGLLKEAQQTGIVSGFDAYQAHDPGEVLLQVFAVWEVLLQRGIKYSDIATTSSASDSLSSQSVRFLSDTLNETHANCVDASVLLASVLRKMGIEPFLVIEPRHMYLGFYLDEDGKQTACLETTMLGEPDPEKCRENRALLKAAGHDARKRKGWRNFNQALDDATRDFRQNKRHFDKSDDPEYEIIDIQAARLEGIAPIAYFKDGKMP